MKTLLTLICLIPLIGLTQLPYNWTAGTNPGWTSSNPSNTTLGWQVSISTVSTSGFNNGTGNWFRYANNQTTNYTSPTLNFTGCSTSSYVTVTPSLDVNLENNWDFLYFQYSTNNGATWITLGTYTGALGAISPSYTIPNSTNRFRFQFTSDPTVNSYSVGFTTYVYFADILGFGVVCPVFLPVELTAFTGIKGNVLSWTVDSETNCDYYTVERSTNGTDWTEVSQVNAVNANSYTVKDDNYENVINYYRLSQTDSDGSKTIFENEIVSINNRTKDLKVISRTNLLGQIVGESATGLVIVTFDDGSSIKEYR